jgi:Xaa-Pro aminopeptidase
MDRAFRLPPTKAVNQTLLAAAGAMTQAAQKEKDVFVKHGLPQDFIEQLKTCATALETAQNAKVESHRRRVTATAALRDQVKRGRKAVRLLNAILEPRLAKDPERLAAWRSAKRVRPTTAVTASDSAASAPSTTKVA